MEKPTAESVADAMYAMVKECHGKRQLKPLDLNKAMLERFAGGCDKAMCKEAIRLLIDSDRCIYSYVGGSTIVLPPGT
jgi:DNA-binding MurR/RpiR family transcriptional regulator